MTGSLVSFSINVSMQVPIERLQHAEVDVQTRKVQRSLGVVPESVIALQLKSKITSTTTQQFSSVSPLPQEDETPRAKQYTVEDSRDFLSCHHEKLAGVPVTSPRSCPASSRISNVTTRVMDVKVDVSEVTSFNNFAGSYANGASSQLSGRCCVIM